MDPTSIRPGYNNTVIPSGAYTTTQTSGDIYVNEGRSFVAVLDTTVFGSGSVTLKIEGKNPNGTYYDILSGAAVTSVSLNRYTISPDMANSANVTANGVLPPVVRVVCTANNSNSQTYNVSVYVAN